MTKIYIKDCTECKDCHSNRTRGTDSFEFAFDYFCHNEEKPRKIAEYVGWNEEVGHVPSWCPRRYRG